MSGRVVTIYDYIIRDRIGCDIADKWATWNSGRQNKISEWKEVRNYIYATDTTKTTNRKLPWKNKTTVPKLCQIKDNLKANYMATIFPKRKFVEYSIDYSELQELIEKKKIMENFVCYMISQENFKNEIGKVVDDYIEFGNGFVMPDWEDFRQELPDKIKVGYVGPTARRISPLDIVFNPIATSFMHSPKIIKSLLSMGEVKEMLERMSTDENRDAYTKLLQYLKDLRSFAGTGSTGSYDEGSKDEAFSIDGFTSFQHYLESDYVEILTFYGDIYDRESDKFYRNYKIMVADRHKVLSMEPNPSYLGFPPIFHVGWRPRPDNLWAMGPLDNLVGLQYRIDHIENLKADVFDLIAFPVLKITGTVDNFEWGPMERIYCPDPESNVDMLVPPFQVLAANQEIQVLMQTMEEMAGSPKEAMGFRTPGEKTKYEVQRLENAASRIFQHRSMQFEELLLEPLINSMMEMARRQLPETISVPIFDDDFKTTTFMQLSPYDISGAGKLRPMAARHFAEKAEIVQNLTAFFSSPIGQDPTVTVHFSGLKVAKLMENVLDISDFELVQPFVRVTEQAEMQRLAQVAQEQLAMEMQTPSGMYPDDVDPEIAGAPTSVQTTPQPGTPTQPPVGLGTSPQG